MSIISRPATESVLRLLWSNIYSEQTRSQPLLLAPKFDRVGRHLFQIRHQLRLRLGLEIETRLALHPLLQRWRDTLLHRRVPVHARRIEKIIYLHYPRRNDKILRALFVVGTQRGAP